MPLSSPGSSVGGPRLRLDGPTDAAGAIADESTPALNAREFLDNNDSYHFFEKLDALIKTGPTGTNVMDVRILLVR